MVCFEPSYAPGDCVFADSPPLKTSAAESLPARRYSERMQKTHGPYRVLHVGPEYLKILQEVFENTVIINRATRVT